MYGSANLTSRILELENERNDKRDIESFYRNIDEEEYDEEQFKIWLQKKEDLNKNIENVCNKYGETLRNVRVLNGANLMYDSEHKLISTSNAKVEIMSSFHTILRQICRTLFSTLKSNCQKTWKISLTLFKCARLEQHLG